jgi:hypothetical protein
MVTVGMAVLVAPLREAVWIRVDLRARMAAETLGEEVLLEEEEEEEWDCIREEE